MTSNSIYHKQAASRPNRRDRVHILNKAKKPGGQVTNPDLKSDQYVRHHVKVFAIILISMISILLFSIKVVEFLWGRRDRAIQTTSRSDSALPTPAVMSSGKQLAPVSVVPSVAGTPLANPRKKGSGEGIDTVFRWGKVLEEAGELEGALARYQEALNLDPNNVAILSQSGRLNIRMNRYNAAIDQLTLANQLSKTNPDIMNDLGVALTFSGREKDAVVLYDDLLNTYPDYTPALFNQGYAMVQIQDYENARPKLESYLAARPDDAMALGVLAVLELAATNTEKAISLLDKAIATDPKLVTPYLDAATICASMSDIPRSLDYLNRALDVGTPAEVYQRFQSAPFDAIRLTPEGAGFEKKVAERARAVLK